MCIDKSITFNDVIGHNEAKDILTTRLQAFFEFKDELKGASKGILLYGYPGTAKTMLAHALVNSLDTSKVYSRIVSSGDLTLHVGSTGRMVKNFFLDIQTQAKGKDIVLIFDEADEILTRKGDKSVIANERVSNILTELDGMEDKNNNVYIIATTNHPAKIEPAMLRSGRIDTHIKTELPTEDERMQLIKKYVSVVPGCEVHEGAILIGTPKYTGADYKRLGIELKLEYLKGKKDNPDYVIPDMRLLILIDRVTKHRKINFATFEQEYNSWGSE